ncbi:hypothetical protein [Photorhabdus aballayi]|uniref:hypothetical protein n=1 Tax=Photorhabdus aballayi TaxID=2991723 RepID=UPI0035D7ED04
MATIPTQTHPLLAIPFNAATDFTVLADHCENFAETLIESKDIALKMALCGRINACLTLLQRAQDLRRVMLRPADISRQPLTGDLFKGITAFLRLLLLLLFRPRIVARAEYGASFFSLPPKRYLSCQSLEPLGLISRYRPCASLSL